jgi:hypothetical protein
MLENESFFGGFRETGEFFEQQPKVVNLQEIQKDVKIL